MARQPRTLVLCANALCPPYRGDHTPACLADPDTKCDGCLPRVAADGLRLCTLCARRLAEDPATLATRYRDLERVLTGAGKAGGEHVSHGGRDPNMQLNGQAVDARTRIRYELTGLVRLIVDERGVRPPTRLMVAHRPDGFIGPMPLVRYADTSVSALARMLGRHAEWLAAHPAAGEHAAILRTVARETYAVAFPAGTRLFPVRLPGSRGVAACPEPVRTRVAFAVSRRGVATEVMGPVPCSGSLWTVLRPNDDRLPAELLCNAVEAHRWPARSWLKLGARFAEALAAVEAELKPAKRTGGSVVSMRIIPDRPNILAEFDAMDAAARRVTTDRGFDIVCRACKATCPVCEGRDEACRACQGRLGEAAWGVPVEALLQIWDRHECPSTVESEAA